MSTSDKPTKDPATNKFPLRDPELERGLGQLNLLDTREAARERDDIRPKLRKAIAAHLEATGTPQWSTELVGFNYADK